MSCWVPTSQGGPASQHPPVSQASIAEVGQGESVTEDTGAGGSRFIPTISAASSIPAISSAWLGAPRGKENQESLSISTYTSVDKSHLADGSASGDSSMAQHLLSDTRPLQSRADPVLTLCSGPVVDASQKHILPG